MAVTKSKPWREQSELTERYLSEDVGPPYVLYLDMWFTRRKRFHCICDANDNPLFRSRWMGDVIDWLDSRDQSTVEARTDGQSWVVELRRVSGEKGNRP